MGPWVFSADTGKVAPASDRRTFRVADEGFVVNGGIQADGVGRVASMAVGHVLLRVEAGYQGVRPCRMCGVPGSCHRAVKPREGRAHSPCRLGVHPGKRASWMGSAGGGTRAETPRFEAGREDRGRSGGDVRLSHHRRAVPQPGALLPHRPLRAVRRHRHRWPQSLPPWAGSVPRRSGRLQPCRILRPR